MFFMVCITRRVYVIWRKSALVARKAVPGPSSLRADSLCAEAARLLCIFPVYGIRIMLREFDSIDPFGWLSSSSLWRSLRACAARASAATSRAMSFLGWLLASEFSPTSLLGILPY